MLPICYATVNFQASDYSTYIRPGNPQSSHRLKPKMGNPRYQESSYSSFRSGSSQSPTLSRESSRSVTTPMRHGNSTAFQFVAWAAGGSTAGAGVRRTTTTTLEPTGQTVSRQGRPGQPHSVKSEKMYEWIRKPKEKARARASFYPPYRHANARSGSIPSSGARPASLPRPFHRVDHNSSAGQAATTSPMDPRRPPPPPPPVVESRAFQTPGPPAQRRNPH